MSALFNGVGGKPKSKPLATPGFTPVAPAAAPVAKAKPAASAPATAAQSVFPEGSTLVDPGPAPASPANTAAQTAIGAAGLVEARRAQRQKGMASTFINGAGGVSQQPVSVRTLMAPSSSTPLPPPPPSSVPRPPASRNGPTHVRRASRLLGA